MFFSLASFRDSFGWWCNTTAEPFHISLFFPKAGVDTAAMRKADHRLPTGESHIMKCSRAKGYTKHSDCRGCYATVFRSGARDQGNPACLAGIIRPRTYWTRYISAIRVSKHNLCLIAEHICSRNPNVRESTTVAHRISHSLHHRKRMSLFASHPTARCMLLRRQDYWTADYQGRWVGYTWNDRRDNWGLNSTLLMMDIHISSVHGITIMPMHRNMQVTKMSRRSFSKN